MENIDTDNLRKIIYLSALLHDIGKFYQRADENPVKNTRGSKL